MENKFFARLEADFCNVIVIADQKVVSGIIISEKTDDQKMVLSSSPFKYDPVRLAHPLREIEDYFKGNLRTFTFPFHAKGTPFQKKVWNELIKIPFGKVVSYQYIAGKLNHPLACRAVGMANHKNPLPLIIPCHRVIGKNNQLVGYKPGLRDRVKIN